MQEPGHVRFEPFRLDLGDERLWRGQEPIHLNPKAFGVLRCLITQAGQLVTKEVLLTAVWPESAVSESVLTVAIRQLRRALGDQARTPSFIETVHRRGYRFIAPVAVSGQTVPPAEIVSHATSAQSHRRLLSNALVSRETELSLLDQWYAAACQGQRRVCFITGEAGIGKTVLVETFIESLSPQDAVWIGTGQCIDQYGEGEPYLPILEALGRLCRGPERSVFLGYLRQYAPSWLIHLKTVLPEAERDCPPQGAHRISQSQMMRELAEAFDFLTSERPFILVLEDLHWSDPSTLAWLAYVARRRDAARLLVIGTYRPVDAIVRAHPLRAMSQELQQHHQCQELILDYLPASGIEAYMRQRFGNIDLSPDMLQALHQHTGGNPLFLIAMLDEFVRQQILIQETTGWRLSPPFHAALLVVPTSLQLMIERQVESLSLDTQGVLKAASAVGITFSIAAVAACLNQPEEVIEDQCVVLANRGQFLLEHGAEVWPNGTISTCYQFRHALYRDVFYAHLAAGQRIQFHHRIALCQEVAYGHQRGEIAAELSMHFIRAHDVQRALPYLLQAADNALLRGAYDEARGHLIQGLDLLEAERETPERTEMIIDFLVPLGDVIMALQGHSTTEFEHVLTRSSALWPHRTEGMPGFLVTMLMWHNVYLIRGDLEAAREIAEQNLRRLPDLDMSSPESARHAIWIHHQMGNTFYCLGQLEAAWTQAEKRDCH